MWLSGLLGAAGRGKAGRGAPVPTRPTKPRTATAPAPPRRALPVGTILAFYLVALGVFVGIVVVRGGPSLGDAYGVTRPTAALAQGDLGSAAHQSVLPQPPGYVYLSSPFVAALRPEVGASTWCDPSVPAVVRVFIGQCSARQLAAHRWYRSQALLGVLAWLVLAVGGAALLRAAGAGGGGLEIALVLALAAAPAASDAIVETFHPQDIVCVGLTLAAVAASVRRRWALAGVLFGVAFLCKQFALLPLVGLVVWAPDWRARARMVAPAAAVVACGLAPFLAVDAGGTWRTLTAVNAGGAENLTTGTVLGLTGLSVSAKLYVARDGPILLALALAWWARRRWRGGRPHPVAIVGLATACLAGRLVLELAFASYYLLAVSAGLLVLDLAARRVPVASVTWIVLCSLVVEPAGGQPTSHTDAVLALLLSLGALFVALRAVWTAPPSDVAGTRRRAPASVAAGAR